MLRPKMNCANGTRFAHIVTVASTVLTNSSRRPRNFDTSSVSRANAFTTRTPAMFSWITVVIAP